MCCAENVMKGKWDHEGEGRRCDHDGQKRLEMFCTPIPRAFCVALAWRVALHKSHARGSLRVETMPMYNPHAPEEKRPTCFPRHWYGKDGKNRRSGRIIEDLCWACGARTARRACGPASPRRPAGGLDWWDTFLAVSAPGSFTNI